MRSMRFFTVSTLSLLLLLTLTACSDRSPGAVVERIPQYYAATTGFSARVRALVNRGSSENEFTLDWTYSNEGSEICIVAPDSVAGVRAGFSPDAHTVEYAGEALVIPETISPVEALPMLSRCWTGTPSEYSGSEGRVQTVSFETLGDNALEFRTTFDTATLNPLEAEVFVNGTRMVTFVFDQFGAMLN